MSEFRLNQRTCWHKSDLQCPLQHACLSLCWCKWNIHFLIAWCTENISYCALFLARKTYELLNSMRGTEKFDCLYSSSESVAICVTQTIFYLLADNRVVFCCWTVLKASATFQWHDKQTKKIFFVMCTCKGKWTARHCEGMVWPFFLWKRAILLCGQGIPVRVCFFLHLVLVVVTLFFCNADYS